MPKPSCFEKDLVIHVGFKKAASTTIQKNLFDLHPNITSLRKGQPHIDFCNYVQLQNYMDYSQEKAYSLFCKAYEDCYVDKNINVLAHENFAAPQGNDVTMVASRLYNLFPNAKIIMLIRNQIPQLQSYYTHLLATKKITGTIDTFIQILSYYQNNFLGHLEYDRTVRAYQTLFGNENVIIRPIEQFKINFQNFSDPLCATLKVDSSSIKSAFSSKDKQRSRNSSRAIFVGNNPFLNKVRSNLPDSILEIVRTLLPKSTVHKPEISHELLTALKNRYQKSNASLEEITGLNLKELGYIV